MAFAVDVDEGGPPVLVDQIAFEQKIRTVRVGWRVLRVIDERLQEYRVARLPRVPDAAFLSVAPDWVCEVLSPSTASLDRAKKLTIYAREQVSHAWLVDPATRTLEVLQLEAGRWVILAVHVGAEVVRAAPFTEIELELASLWPEE